MRQTDGFAFIPPCHHTAFGQGVELAAGNASARRQKHSDCALFLPAEKLSNPAQI
jgi:hypothetical protein